ncbi:uncharacterized protein EHS24_007307 [Apiotrichum porosum]|uniref:Uncharacterized protein n=1 Tax=Apiotrichum porosum TaxID=105984 RepID=A0A427XU18_9TREE|nr:uncharacterized protein EHS24_007307 [Apiotrichum porosum]RSH82340.1 hypothetical protein EHS24_007307 [Apiotrichum porosum]
MTSSGASTPCSEMSLGLPSALEASEPPSPSSIAAALFHRSPVPPATPPSEALKDLPPAVNVKPMAEDALLSCIKPMWGNVVWSRGFGSVGAAVRQGVYQ